MCWILIDLKGIVHPKMYDILSNCDHIVLDTIDCLCSDKTKQTFLKIFSLMFHQVIQALFVSHTGCVNNDRNFIFGWTSSIINKIVIRFSSKHAIIKEKIQGYLCCCVCSSLRNVFLFGLFSIFVKTIQYKCFLEKSIL